MEGNGTPRALYSLIKRRGGRAVAAAVRTQKRLFRGKGGAPGGRPVWKRALGWTLCLGLLAGAGVVGANLMVTISTRNAILSVEQANGLTGDCILVLGCGVGPDGSPGQMLRDRLDVAIEAYNMGVSDRLLMSGDHGRESYDEVNAMKDYAMARGVPSAHIFMDHAGFSTYESMYRAREIFEAKRVVVVTQAYHLYRAIYDARAMGMEAVGIRSDLRRYARQRHFDIREAAARAKDAIWCLVKPPPSYLGEAIPIFGNGDATNDKT